MERIINCAYKYTVGYLTTTTKTSNVSVAYHWGEFE